MKHPNPLYYIVRIHVNPLISAVVCQLAFRISNFTSLCMYWYLIPFVIDLTKLYLTCIIIITAIHIDCMCRVGIVVFTLSKLKGAV